jgi:hypothetical protein
MLVACNHCGISFDHALGRCVACGSEYVPTTEEKLALLTADVEDWLRSGAGRTQVFDCLTGEYDLSEQDAQTVVSAARQALRRDSRRHGQYIAGSGVVLLIVALLVYLFTGGLVVATGCLIVGGAMLVLGLLKAATGWNLTGRDDEPDGDAAWLASLTRGFGWGR